MTEKKESFKIKIAYSYSTILSAKLRNFRKHSLLKYTFSAVIYSVVLTLIRGGNPLSKSGAIFFLNFFLLFICLSVLLMFVSSWLMARKYADKSMIYTFSSSGIHIHNEINKLEEEHDWNWIRSYELTKKALYLLIQSKKPFEIILNRPDLSQEELDSLILWLGNRS
ncbi:hypothetical protein [Oceanispirochaeta sp.]|jgi:hypothetical protein|uniref:hypothetical protein n=1 Tax=Oceanispirochaeta sp. TaxID=2035350 RepID=UPI00261CD1F2|nr:hypothetical protein [Oceanispirochaeta sp.]MDA3955916.1 hypothetical protein [Oceanispirochaeta sp.]